MAQEPEQLYKPIIGITLGDFNGIGPEVIFKTLNDSRITKLCTPVIYASIKVIQRWKKLLDLEDFHYQGIKSIDEVNLKKINVVQVWEDDYAVEPGKVTDIAGKCAYLSLKAATEDLQNNKLDGIVTSPINKKNIQNEEFKYAGHTEFFADKFGKNSESLMFLVAEKLKVAVVTGHIPISKVASTITKDLIVSKAKLILNSLKKDFGLGKPKVAILGLNPHAGDNGIIGTEDDEIVSAAIEELKNGGNLVFGPYPADGFFGNGSYDKFDAVLAMYHDQGLIPFKTLSMETGVNYTAGLSVVRTSPDHGTAYDIAGKNKADETSFREALFTNIQILKYKKGLLVVHGL
ncbi:MAG: 4-hydroxythreonine-4-phosphate dehydrogenase PdxA [Bacteroidota bacterium]|jgi:4-hydroxythreonine-4-phosphate dehydrogenase